MDDLRSWWEVPSIAHFCSLFRNAFNLTDFDIEDLEIGLVESEKEEGSEFILDLLCRLLNGCYARKDISGANFDLYVKDIIKYKWEGSDNPIKEKTEFKELTLREKVELILAICEYRLDTEDVVDQLKGLEGDSMRVEPLGKDKDGALYWYFFGIRLYKEDPAPKTEISREEKRAKEKQRREELKKKKVEEEKRRKEGKKKKKQLKKAQKEKEKRDGKKPVEEEESEDGGNRRRSGRIRGRKMAMKESSSDSSDSSEEEEEEDQSAEETEDQQGEVTPAKSGSRGRPKMETPSKGDVVGKKGATPASSKQETSGRGRPRRGQTASKGKADSTPQSDARGRRSTRLRGKVEPPPPPSPHYDSDTEDEDIDSGHESACSEHSEVSKLSVKSGASNSQTPSKLNRASRRPTVNLSLRRDLSKAADDDEEVEEEDEKGKDLDDDKDKRKDLDDAKDKGNDLDNAKEKVKGDHVRNKEEEDDVEKGDRNHQEKTTEEIKEGDRIGEGAMEVDNVEDAVKTEIKDEKTKDESKWKPNEGTGDLAEGTGGDIKMETDNPTLTENSQEAIGSDQVKTEPDSGVVKMETDESENKNISENIGENDNKHVTDVKEVKENKNDETENEESKPENYTGSDDKEANEESKSGSEENEGDDKIIDKKEMRTRRMTRSAVKPKEENTEDDEDTSEKKEPESESLAAMREKVDNPLSAEEPTVSKSSTRWHVICASLDDWINLSEWYKDSQVRSEKALSKIIREDFLPVLPEIIEAREKEKLKKLMQEQDVRRSDRITSKMREKMDQERILAEALVDEEKAKIKAEEERRLKEEHQKLEEENKQREERRKAREERSKRLSMREERARLLAEGKEIPPELIYTATQKYKDDGEDSDDSRCDLKVEEDYQALMKVVNAMKYHKDCWPFLYPVTDDDAPGYSDVIKRPMDMSRIEQKVEQREYRQTAHFLSDFKLMFNNCKRFNGPDSEFSECARSMELMLKKYIKRFLKDEPTDKYYEDKDFHMGVGRTAAAVGEKKFRPRRAASSRAMETVHKALRGQDDEETSSDEEISQTRNVRSTGQSPIKPPSHHDLLLQEMIELKRQREKNLAMSALQNHKVITRGPERITVPNPKGGVMIIPKEEMSSGVLRMAATREIKRKVDPGFAQNPTRFSSPAGKRDAGLNIIDHSLPGSKQPKTIRIVAGGPGHASVKETAESVKVNSDGFLIIGGKNSGIKVTENTKIVIQPQPAAQGGATPAQPGQPLVGPTLQRIVSPNPQPGTSKPMGEMQLKKIPTPSGIGSVQGMSLASASVNQSVMGAQAISRPACSAPVVNISSLSQSAAGTQASGQLTPDLQKKLDIAQRILLLSQHKKRVIDQQQQQQQGGVSPAKMMRLEPSTSGQTIEERLRNTSDQRSIEERLREPNIDNKVVTVSQSVISNVNIASDILDTYYSVLNENKTKQDESNTNTAQTTTLQVLNQQPVVAQANVVFTSNAQTIQPQSVTSQVADQGVQLSSAEQGQQSPKITSPSANLTRQIVDLLKMQQLKKLQQQSQQSGQQTPLQQQHQQHPQNMQQQQQQQLRKSVPQPAQVQVQHLAQLSLSQPIASQQSGSIPVVRNLSSMTQILSGGTSVSDILKAAFVKGTLQKPNVSSIDALIRKNSASNSQPRAQISQLQQQQVPQVQNHQQQQQNQTVQQLQQHEQKQQQQIPVQQPVQQIQLPQQVTQQVINVQEIPHNTLGMVQQNSGQQIVSMASPAQTGIVTLATQSQTAGGGNIQHLVSIPAGSIGSLITPGQPVSSTDQQQKNVQLLQQVLQMAVKQQHQQQAQQQQAQQQEQLQQQQQLIQQLQQQKQDQQLQQQIQQQLQQQQQQQQQQQVQQQQPPGVQLVQTQQFIQEGSPRTSQQQILQQLQPQLSPQVVSLGNMLQTGGNNARPSSTGNVSPEKSSMISQLLSKTALPAKPAKPAPVMISQMIKNAAQSNATGQLNIQQSLGQGSVTPVIQSSPTNQSSPEKVVVSPQQIGRKSLFDMFQGACGQTEVDQASLQRFADQLKIQGLRLPSSSTVNFGSPLKTSAIMDALKNKLQPVKQEDKLMTATPILDYVGKTILPSQSLPSENQSSMQATVTSQPVNSNVNVQPYTNIQTSSVLQGYLQGLAQTGSQIFSQPTIGLSAMSEFQSPGTEIPISDSNYEILSVGQTIPNNTDSLVQQNVFFSDQIVSTASDLELRDMLAKTADMNSGNGNSIDNTMNSDYNQMQYSDNDHGNGEMLVQDTSTTNGMNVNSQSAIEQMLITSQSGFSRSTTEQTGAQLIDQVNVNLQYNSDSGQYNVENSTPAGINDIDNQPAMNAETFDDQVGGNTECGVTSDNSQYLSGKFYEVPSGAEGFQMEGAFPDVGQGHLGSDGQGQSDESQGLQQQVDHMQTM
ncbi:uncharacterized protein LOC128231883 [Mya arenaria]|nr:uncharacterized protein LOC128231883 [Mya arenaria]